MPDSFEDKKRQIIKASKTIFARYGYHKTTLDDIADSVGIKKNSLYYYFPSKEALFTEIIHEEAEAVFLSQDQAIDREKSAAKKLRICIKMVIEAIRQRTLLHSATLKAFLEIGQIVEKFHKEFRKRQLKIIADILKEGIDKGEFKRHNTVELAENLLTLARAIQHREFHTAQTEFLHDIDFAKIDKTVSNLLDIIIDGLQCKKSN